MITNLKHINNPTWQDKSLCKDYDPALWFKKGNARVAKAICAVCPVQKKCLDWILILEKNGAATTRTGIYGGLTANQRSKIALCKYRNCVERTRTRKDFCSKEHKELHLAALKRARDGEDHTGIYYKQGRVPQ